MKVQEIVIARYQDEDEWTIDTSDPGFAQILQTKGWAEHSSTLPYRRFKLPKKALTIRSRAAVEKARPLPVWVKRKQASGAAPGEDVPF